MNATSHNGGKCNFENTYPGCLGRMVNLFELNIGVSANKLLTDKPHHDGSPVSRSRSDVSRMSPSLDQLEEKVIASELTNSFSNKKAIVTPMKMLIAEEMSNEVDSRRSSPNLVAKLMGLDALPQQEPDSSVKKSQYKGHPRRHSEIPMSNWVQRNGFFHYVEPDEIKDVYKIWQQSQKSTRMGRCDETTNAKKLEFVRQKFVEVKRLSMDEKLRHSKQFQEALEVLNSNKDLFLKCLQEPNSALSKQFYNLQTIPPPPETKRITVLRPSKMAPGAENGEDRQMRKGSFVQSNDVERSHLGGSPPPSWKNYENPTQPTRIVVLKPSPGKILDDKAVASPQCQSERINRGELFGDVDNDENLESREVAKAITKQMREKLGRHQRDETLISSVFSNGYAADESSFNKSEIEYPAGNLSDSEIMSPVSRHSWDCANRLGSPFSVSSFSRASYSPESSVCREAKKRLSERWAMMASSGSCPEQKPVRRSSSTLGEMLALSEAKKVAVPGEGSSNQEPNNSNPLLSSEHRADKDVDNSVKNLTRSKSVPVSSSQIGTGHSADISLSEKYTIEIPKEDTKVKGVKSSFRGKVSSLFFSRSKKSSNDKSVAPETNDEPQSCSEEIVNDKTEKGPGCSSPTLMESSNKSLFSNLNFKQNMISPETLLSNSEPIASGNPIENQDQPSPVSVLDQTFEEYQPTSKLVSQYVEPYRNGSELPIKQISTNLIDKSPPIGSVARTLLWDYSCMDTASSYPIKESLSTQATDEGEQEWCHFVETLLSVAGLQGDIQPGSFLARWYSPESPLNPSLRDKYIDLNDKDMMHEAKRRQKRSMQKLIFDCVNTVLVEIGGESGSSGIVEDVWSRMGGWFSGETRCIGGDDDNNLVVEMMVRKEVVGNGWVDNWRRDKGNLWTEIEGMLLEELVVEAVVELRGGE